MRRSDEEKKRRREEAERLLRFRVAAVLGLLLPLLVGYNTGAKWPYGEIEIRANTQSFVNNINGANLALAASDYEWWVAWAASQWRIASGADFFVDYLGTTTIGCTSASVGYDDGVNVVAAAAGCAGGNCGILGLTQCQGSGQSYGTCTATNLIEADVCMYPGPPGFHQWDIQGGLGEQQKDLVGTLVHELGHMFGFGHPEPSQGAFDGVMSNNVLGYGNTLGRHLSGDDVDGVRALYGTRTESEHVREFLASSGTWGTRFSKPGSLNLPSAGALGLFSGQWRVFRAAVNTAQTRLYVDNTLYRAAAGSSWSNYYATRIATVAPAAAADDASPSNLLVALPSRLSLYSDTCAGVRLWRSTDMFASSSSVDVADICTNHAVALAYETQTNRWVMAWNGHAVDNAADEDDQGKLFFRTSTNGTTWSAATEIESTAYMLDGPSLACADDGNCVVAYISTITDKPLVRVTEFTINGAGQVVIGSSAQDSSSFSGRTPVVGYTSSDRFFVWSLWTNSYANVARGDAEITALSWADGSFPSSLSGWVASGEVVTGGISAASHPGRPYAYAFWSE